MSEGPSAGDRAMKIASTLLEHLDLAASFVLDSVQDHLVEPLETVRRVLWLTIAVLLAVAAYALVWPDLFMTYLPQLVGGVTLLAAAAAAYLDHQAKLLKRRIRELSRRAENWRKVAGWARDRLD